MRADALGSLAHIPACNITDPHCLFGFEFPADIANSPMGINPFIYFILSFPRC